MENEKPSLPEGWEWKRLGDVAEKVKGKKPQKLLSQNQKDTLPYLTADYIRMRKRPIYVPLTNNKNIIKIDKDDIILIWDGSKSGDVFTGQKGILASTMAKIQSKEVINKFLFYFVKSKFELLNQKTKGAAIPHVDEKVFYDLQIPLPPLPVQKQIVEKLDTLMASIENAKKLHKQSADLTNTLMQAAIQHEFSRAEEEGWEWKRLGEVVIDMKNGIYKPKKYYGHGIPMLRMYNINDGRINLNKLDRVELTPKEFNKYKLLPGDILVNRVNSRELVGKSGLIIDSVGDCVFESKNIRIRLRKEVVIPAYINYFMNSKKYKVTVFNKIRPAIGQATINQEDLKSIEIPIPPLPVQKHIVEKLDGIRAMVESLKRQQKDRSDWLDKLPKALLEKAFRGELC